MLERWEYEEMKEERSSDSLVKAIDRIEMLEKQLKIAVDTLKTLEGWSDLAREALEDINNVRPE